MSFLPSREGLLDRLERLAEYRPSPVTLGWSALGHPIDPLAAVVLTTASVLATAAGVFPGGLGTVSLLTALHQVLSPAVEPASR